MFNCKLSVFQQLCLMKCDYLLSTDKRMLKYKSETVRLVNPIEFIDLLNGGNENDD